MLYQLSYTPSVCDDGCVLQCPRTSRKRYANPHGAIQGKRPDAMRHAPEGRIRCN